MSFLTPLAFLGFLLFIPVILLYLLKQKRRRVIVSTLMFWDEILRDEHSVASITKLRKILSLLLQLLVLLLLILALAQPILAKDTLGARRIVILLDTSASMLTDESGQTRFALAQAKAREVITGMASGDTAMLVSVGAHQETVMPFTSSRRTLQEALDGISAGHGGTNFADAFAFLKQLPPDERETWVYVIGDGAFDSVPFEGNEKMRFAYLPVGQAKDNVGITAFQVRPLPALPRDFEIMFTIANESDAEVSLPFEVHVADSLVDADEITVPARGIVNHSLRQFSATGGAVKLVADWDDAFQLDNTAYAVLPPAVVAPVALVTEGNYFFESALMTDDAIKLESMTPTQYAEKAATLEAKVIIFDGWVPDALPDRHTIYVGKWPESLGITASGDLSEPIITEWDQEHPVNRHLQLTNISIEAGQRLAAPETFTPLIQSFENPLVLLDESKPAMTMVVGFNTASSDLPLRVAFPILVSNTIRYMTGGSDQDAWQAPEMGAVLGPEDIAQYAGESKITSVIAPGEALEQEADEAPDQEVEVAPAAAPAALASVSVDRAGIYSGVTEAGDTIPLFAANLNNRREANIAVSEGLPVKSDKPLQEITDGFRIGAAPWRLLAVSALALLVLEWGLFHRRWVE
jgi:hypothetical protein